MCIPLEEKGRNTSFPTEHVQWYMLTCTVGREKAVGRFTLYVGETNKKGGVSPHF